MMEGSGSRTGQIKINSDPGCPKTYGTDPDPQYCDKSKILKRHPTQVQFTSMVLISISCAQYGTVR
jgi:hypothetical protein